MAQTGNRVSSLAARYVGITSSELFELTATAARRQQTAKEISSIAASALRQDETRGIRGLIKRVLG